MGLSFQNLATERYVSLVTFRKNGVGIPTTVWIAPSEGKLYAVTDGTSAKMRRLKVTNRIRLAACGPCGSVRGEWTDGSAHKIEDPAVIDRAISALFRKYGWRFGVATLFSCLSRRIGRRAYLEITI